MTADEEDLYKVATANEPLNPDGTFVNDRITVRDKVEIVEIANPVGSYDRLEAMKNHVAGLLRKLELPFRSWDDIVWRGQLSNYYLTKYNNQMSRFGDVAISFAFE